MADKVSEMEAGKKGRVVTPGAGDGEPASPQAGRSTPLALFAPPVGSGYGPGGEKIWEEHPLLPAGWVYFYVPLRESNSLGGEGVT